MNSSSSPANATAGIGRFAPSPTGPLHFGSLISALASYLDARSRGGQWLVRMEDLDPPREQPGAADAILASLEKHGLEWDGSVMYQSQRQPAYRETLEKLEQAELVYPCNCTRRDLQATGGVYQGRCRQRKVDVNKAHALRLKVYDLPSGSPRLPEITRFDDLIQGPQSQSLRLEAGDQIVRRKDGLFAYQLAVVVDDIAQGISHIIRGSDLLEVSARQQFLFQLLGAKPPMFGHVPVAVNAEGQKLSKQNLAPPLNPTEVGANLWRALAFLSQQPPGELAGARPEEILAWGLQHWRMDTFRGQLQAPALFGEASPVPLHSDRTPDR